MKAIRTIIGPDRVARRTALAWLLWLASLTGAQAVALQDYFTNRETIFTPNGTLLGTNITATIENNEPRHGGKEPSHSLWITWVAPTNGIATFDTHGSSFDTLMSAYTLNPPNGTTVHDLHEEARNDEDPALPPTSLIQFGAIAGHSYQIAVDGYNGAKGVVVLHWSFTPSDNPPPIIVSTPPDQAAMQGDQVVLSVDLASSGNAQFRWYLNDVQISGQSTPTYIINSLQPANVGRYKLRVDVGSGSSDMRFFTAPVELQINSEGSTNSVAMDKLFDALMFPLIGDDGTGLNGSGQAGSVKTTAPASKAPPLATSATGVVRGYNGSQVFSTTSATSDPAEPAHCGVTGGASYWLSYQPPANGTMTIDTIGSSYDTVMAIYSYNGTMTSYADLIPITCDNDSVSLHGPSRVTFQAVKTRQYFLVVDGVGGARGTAHLNYTLNTNLPATAPTLQSLVVTQTVTVGATVTLAPTIGGAPPMKYAWKKNGTNVTGVTIPFLQLTNVTTAATANYTLTITNDLGTLIVTNPVHVVVPPTCAASPSGTNLNLSFSTVSSFRYTIQQATNAAGPWTQWATPFIGNGSSFTTNIAGPDTKFFRVSVE